MELGVLLIPILIVVSGAIALVGNAVGRNIGRRRLSLFQLRPRYTAQIVTVITGMLITIVTLIVVLLISSEARVALFRLNAVLRQTHQLEEEIRRQEDRLKQLALGDIAYLGAVRQRVLADVERATDMARENGIGPDGHGDVVVLTPPRASWDDIAHLVDLRETDTVVRLVASQNTLKGEPLTVFVQLFDNRLVYAQGTVLVEGIVDGRQAREVISRELLRLADQSARLARGRVLPPPFTLVTAPAAAQVDIDAHRAAVAKVQRAGRQVLVQVVAPRDVYTVGPLTVSFTVR
ncbi:MAG: DUF3084 domain-containing protein [Bacillati bacterium ANGP1]|uniref:DUF3084 domain-containing protein n=1 Tax=Candidatus Segetimicrobium genomatis TaxID=2569760 RepID=A0A537IX82_9BACT|nr:MAG: DUF3084 domain-containing protein [Terrabacteria group bacterium ANGP1]